MRKGPYEDTRMDVLVVLVLDLGLSFFFWSIGLVVVVVVVVVVRDDVYRGLVRSIDGGSGQGSL